MFCEGQLLPISENETLFQLIGTTYGGDGQSTFALPDLRGRLPIHAGNGFILAETSLLEIPILVTSDAHLLDMDSDLLKITFDEASLAQVTPFHPTRLLRAIRR